MSDRTRQDEREGWAAAGPMVASVAGTATLMLAVIAVRATGVGAGVLLATGTALGGVALVLAVGWSWPTSGGEEAAPRRAPVLAVAAVALALAGGTSAAAGAETPVGGADDVVAVAAAPGPTTDAGVAAPLVVLCADPSGTR